MASLEPTNIPGGVKLAPRTRMATQAALAARAEAEANPAPAGNTGILPPADVIQPILPDNTTGVAITPETTQTTTIPAPPAGLGALPAVPPAPAVTTPTEPAVDVDGLQAQLAQMQADLEAARADNEAVKKQRDEFAAARAELDEVRAAQAEANLRQTLLDSGVENLSHLDQEQFAEIIDRALMPALKQEQAARANSLTALQAQMQQMQDTIAAREEAAQQQTVAAKRQIVNDKILEKHPDFVALRKDPAYKQYVSQPIYPGATLTLDDFMALEYQKGNADSIIGVLDHYRGGQPSPSTVASVAPTQSSPSMTAGPSESDGLLSYEEQEQLRLDWRSGKITRAEMTAKMEKHRQAKQGNPNA